MIESSDGMSDVSSQLELHEVSVTRATVCANLSNENRLGGINHLLPAFTSALLVSIGYIDPGKWAATVEGTVRFGFDTVAFMLVFNCAAVLCQSLSSHITGVTGKNLAEIYKDEYDQCLCLFLGIQVEVSTIALDIAMVLGIAHGLNLLLGLDLFSCFFLTALDAVLFPFSANFLGSCKDKFQWLCIGCVVLFTCAFGLLLSQVDASASLNGLPTKLSADGVYVLMSLLGASIMPQNIYLQSVLVQKQTRTSTVKSSLYNDHLFASICVFSGIYLASYVLATSAVNASIDDPGLVLLTFQDAPSLIEQLFRSSITALAYLLVLIGTSQITSLIWNIGGEPVLQNFLRLYIPSWVHRAGVRMVSILLATFFLRNSGAEGLYQFLIFIQVIVALLLPSSVIPLFRVATCRSLMGRHKISQFVKFVACIAFISMFGMNIVFVVEMIFRSNDWAANFLWNIDSNSSSPYVILLATACASLCLMLWLSATPLKLASSPILSQGQNSDIQMTTPGFDRGREQSNSGEFRPFDEKKIEKFDPSVESGKCSGEVSATSAITYAADMPEVECQQKCHSATIEDKQSTVMYQSSHIGTRDEKSTGAQSLSESNSVDEIADNLSSEIKVKKIDVVQTVEVEVGLPTKGSDEVPFDDEVPRMVSRGTLLLTPEAPGSLRRLHGKGDDIGTFNDSLTRLAGLGRAARRQLAATLDEFWGQLFDLHGQVTQEAKLKKLDVLLGIESKNVSLSQKMEAYRLDSAAYFPNIGRAESNSSAGSCLLETLGPQRMQTTLDSPYKTHTGSLSSHQLRLLSAYEQVSSPVFPDASERRYSSLRLPSYSEILDNQPATVHGSQIASYINGIGVERNSEFNRKNELLMQNSLSLHPLSYRDSNAFALEQRLQNGLSLARPSFRNIPALRNDLMQQEMPYYEPFSPSPSAGVISPVNEKKYRSLPDISGASLFHRNLGNSNQNTQWDSAVSYGRSLHKTSYEPSLFSNPRSMGGPLAFDEISPDENYTQALSMQLTSNVQCASLWSKQPYEQFGLAGRCWTTPSGFESKPNITANPLEIPDAVDREVMLLRSLKQCISKLLKLEGSDWLFKQNIGADEELIDRVTAREKLLSEAENREMTRMTCTGDAQYLLFDRKSAASPKTNEAGSSFQSVPTVPHCGDDCIWKAKLIVSFGVWCIRKILDLSLMESRPELWGKYTYVLNRLQLVNLDFRRSFFPGLPSRKNNSTLTFLHGVDDTHYACAQGVIDPAFAQPRSPAAPCFCLLFSGVNDPPTSTLVLGNGSSLPSPAKSTRRECTTAAMVLDTIKGVEGAISGRKGRTGTAAGDVAFPKGKENLASVLKRYKHRLSKLPGSHEASSNPRKVQPAGSYGS